MHILTKDRWDSETKSWVPNEGDSPVLKHMKEFGFDEDMAILYEAGLRYDPDEPLLKDPKAFEEFMKKAKSPEGVYIDDFSVESTKKKEKELEESIYRATLKVLRERKLRKNEI